MVSNLIVVFILTMIIHTAETLSYSIRFAGVRLNKIAVALSLTGIVVLVSRTANMIQAPLTATFIDYARDHPQFEVITYIRVILLAASVGTVLAIMLFPTFELLFGRVISRLELVGSLPKVLTSVTIQQVKNTKHYVRKPYYHLQQFRYLGVPKRFLVMQILVTAFYTVGVMASLYAAHLLPHLSTTASQASGLINGIATVILALFIDPQLGLITDQALKDENSKQWLGKIYILLMGSRFIGTLIAQLILVPAAYFIGFMIQLL